MTWIQDPINSGSFFHKNLRFFGSRKFWTASRHEIFRDWWSHTRITPGGSNWKNINLMVSRTKELRFTQRKKSRVEPKVLFMFVYTLPFKTKSLPLKIGRALKRNNIRTIHFQKRYGGEPRIHKDPHIQSQQSWCCFVVFRMVVGLLNWDLMYYGRNQNSRYRVTKWQFTMWSCWDGIDHLGGFCSDFAFHEHEKRSLLEGTSCIVVRIPPI